MQLLIKASFNIYSLIVKTPAQNVIIKINLNVKIKVKNRETVAYDFVVQNHDGRNGSIGRILRDAIQKYFGSNRSKNQAG